ncbi:MAG: YdbL family protein [Gammaproteobacteria bacterium]|nr:YdbL family protein [Gammaproteobacteria bacterium]MDH5303711.1 YdbL family protein [Gammaproteobacteria bacterium]MDH5322707.1 YdbL family protein [Gammaproteobacteria bacterium]
MNRVMITTTALLAAFVAACVTINVYFPEAAAVEAADRIIDKVRGDTDSGASLEATPRQAPVMLALAKGFASLLVSDANAQSQIDFDKPSPEKQALENSLAARFPSLKPYFDSGAIGVNDTSVIEFRDRNLVPLKDRNTVVQLVSAQNNDWNALYAEIAKLNGHPEWLDNIRRTFAERWIAKADKGWWYREGGSWKQK